MGLTIRLPITSALVIAKSSFLVGLPKFLFSQNVWCAHIYGGEYPCFLSRFSRLEGQIRAKEKNTFLRCQTRIERARYFNQAPKQPNW